MYTRPSLVPELTTFVEGQLWTARAPLRFYGVPMGCRMTVCRLGDGRLFVHSPIALDTVREALDRIGEVAYAIAPNFIHHLFMAPFLDAYPTAQLFVSPKLVSKRGDLDPQGVLGDEPPEDTWGDTIDQLVVRGSRLMDEVVFLHRPSRTLILCDLCQCMHADAPWLWRQVGRLIGIYQRYGPPIDMKVSFRDREALRSFVEPVLDWDFDRIVLSHGNLVERGGKDVFRRAYGFCLS
jgi:hypothetical protein